MLLTSETTTGPVDNYVQLEAFPPAGPIKELLAAHAPALIAFSADLRSFNSLFDAKGEERTRVYNGILRGIGPEAQGRAYTRAAEREGRRSKVIVALTVVAVNVGVWEGLESARKGQVVRLGIEQVLCGASPTHRTTIRCVADQYSPVFRSAELARISVADPIRELLISGALTGADLLTWVTESDLSDPVEHGLVATLIHDLNIGGGPDQSEGVLRLAIDQVTSLTPESFIPGFVIEFASGERAHTREAKWLNFLKSFAGIDSQRELIARLRSAGEVPPELFSALSAFQKEQVESLIANFRQRVREVDFLSIDPTLDDINALWESVPTQPLDGLTGREKAAQIHTTRKRRRVRQAGNSGGPQSGSAEMNGTANPEDGERLDEPHQLFVVIRGETHHLIQQSQTVEDLITEYVDRYTGTPGLADEIRAALQYLATMRIPKGVKKFDNLTLTLDNDPNRRLPVHSLKSTSENALQGSKRFKKTRIEFVYIPGSGIGIVSIHSRDDTISGRRSKA